MLGGRGMLGWVLLTQMPSVLYWMHFRSWRRRVGMADLRGSTSPRPPCLVDMVAMWKAWLGMEVRSVSVERMVCVMRLKLVVMSLSHRKRLSGRLSKSVVRTSDARRWVSLCCVQVRYS